MKRRNRFAVYLVFGAAALAIAFGMYAFQPVAPSADSPATNSTLVQVANVGIQNQTELPTERVNMSLHADGESSYAKAFSESHNYLEFVNSIIEAAKSGNRDAEYYLGKALRVCNESSATFRFNSQAIDLDEALRRYSSSQNSQRKIRAVYERCHDLEAVGDQAKRFGNSEDWIKAASDQSQPVAQSDVAVTAFLEMQKSSARVDGVLNAPPSGKDPHSLLLAAVRTKDPDVLFNIGQAQAYLSNFDADSTKNELAWWLVACESGLSCDSNSEFQRNVALNDSLLETLSGRDLICTMAGKDCQDVEQRAQKIADKIKAEQWDQLGL